MKRGMCGDNLFWTLDDDGTLTIDGTGVMYNFTDKLQTPWHEFKLSAIKKVVINDGATSIGDEAFSRCYGLTSVEIPASVYSIGNKAFFACFDLAAVNVPSGVMKINNQTFQRCTSLTSFKIPSHVRAIGYWAFEGCSGLTEIKIPAAVTSIGWQSFDGCINLEKIFYKAGRGFEEDLSVGNPAQLIPY